MVEPLYVGGDKVREQNTAAKSWLGRMTAVRGAVPAQGPEAHAAPFMQSHTHPFSPTPPARAENTGVRDMLLSGHFSSKEVPTTLFCRVGTGSQD